jgi:hypothetical protein
MTYIASITTYPARFEYFLKAVKSIDMQSVRSKTLVVNIAKEDMLAAEQDLVRRTKFAYSRKVIFQYVENLRPANKIIPTAKNFPNDIIVTFDDDILYPQDRVKSLMRYHELFPKNPIAYRTRQVEFKGKSLTPYNSWKLSYHIKGSSPLNFPTSVSGSLYPPGIFPEEFFDTETYKKLCHTNDDIWTYFHMLKNKTAFVKAGNEIKPPDIDGSQATALWRGNVSKGSNDKMMKALEKEYGNVYDLAKDFEK